MNVTAAIAVKNNTIFLGYGTFSTAPYVQG
jgi:hypothetical protein